MRIEYHSNYRISLNKFEQFLHLFFKIGRPNITDLGLCHEQQFPCLYLNLLIRVDVFIVVVVGRVHHLGCNVRCIEILVGSMFVSDLKIIYNRIIDNIDLSICFFCGVILF